ncbi:phenylacetate--CoA ligase family protein [Brevibacillus dissolubilis]|uniref:phenylacetate--CoA ligase family protein n=1 Tax=Brevibacillus dissolubilis TaxID=1844116 RepID=UPI0011162BE8|nr:AMP-binding protein [Brevibacillus dissolubilis]
MKSKFVKKLRALTIPKVLEKYFSGPDHPDVAPLEVLKEFQFEALQEIVTRAYEKVPFYREKMEAVGFKPEDLKTLADLDKLPFLTKDELRGKPWVLLAVDKSEVALVQVSTGTTGGEEIYMMYTWNDYYVHDLAPTYGNLFPIEQEDICLNGLPYEMSAAGLAFHKTFMEGVSATVIPTGKGGAYSTPEKTVKMMRDLKPNIIITSPSWAIMLAETAEEAGFDLKSLNLKKMYLTGEGCSHAFRQRVEKIYGVTANFFYGSLECGVLGIECDKHDGYHVAEGHAIMEFIDPKTDEVLEPGEIGEIVVTPVVRFDSPMLRYRTKDLGYLETNPCSCGVTMPKFYLRGRLVDQIEIMGASLSPYYLEEFLMRIPEVGNWFEFVIRDGVDSLKVRCEAAKGVTPSDELAEQLASKMEFGVGVPFEFEFVDKMPRPTGKTIRVVHE